MKYIELGEVFKINVNNKTVYLKSEIDTSIMLCENCYFNKNLRHCNKFACTNIDREDNTNVIYKQINPIQTIYIVLGETKYGFIKQCGAYPNKEDAEKEIEKLNKLYHHYTHYYRTVEYYPYGIINDIKEVKIN